MEEGFVCIIDILGTKGVWAHQSIDKYFASLEVIDGFLEKAKQTFNEISKGGGEFDAIFISDTLIITAISNIKATNLFESALEGICEVLSGVFQIYYSEDLFIRGAL